MITLKNESRTKPFYLFFKPQLQLQSVTGQWRTSMEFSKETTRQLPRALWIPDHSVSRDSHMNESQLERNPKETKLCTSRTFLLLIMVSVCLNRDQSVSREPLGPRERRARGGPEESLAVLDPWDLPEREWVTSSPSQTNGAPRITGYLTRASDWLQRQSSEPIRHSI